MVQHKLIRDKSVELKLHDPEKHTFEVTKGQKYVSALQERICDGAERYKMANSDREAVEELVDLLELIHTVLPLHNMTFEELDMVRRRKKMEQGSFETGQVLIQN